MKSVLFFTGLLLFFCFYSKDVVGINDSSNKHDLDLITFHVDQDVIEAREIVDSMKNVAKTDYQKIIVFLLLARLDKVDGQMKSCILNAMRADTIAAATLNFSWRATTSYFLAVTFRQLGLIGVAERYLKYAETANNKQSLQQAKRFNHIKILQEKAKCALDKLDYLNARKWLQTAGLLLEKYVYDDPNVTRIKVINDQLLGLCAYRLGDLKVADDYLNAALKKIGQGNNDLRAYIYQTQADIQIERNNLVPASFLLQYLTLYLTNHDIQVLQMLTYKSWEHYHKKAGDIAKALEFKSLADNMHEQRDQTAKKVLEELVEMFNRKKQNDQDTYMIAISFIFFIAVVVVVVILYFSKRKSEVVAQGKESLALVLDIKEAGSRLADSHIDLRPIIGKKQDPMLLKVKEINISKVTEERLYREFVKLEKAHFYLIKQMSLKHLAKDMGTNIRYVSYILQKYRGKDFYNYIQFSRIEYMIEKLRSSPELFEYKISFLAELCGFSSLSGFSNAFKDVTGIPPSAYIHFLKKEMNQEKNCHNGS